MVFGRRNLNSRAGSIGTPSFGEFIGTTAMIRQEERLVRMHLICENRSAATRSCNTSEPMVRTIWFTRRTSIMDENDRIMTSIFNYRKQTWISTLGIASQNKGFGRLCLRRSCAKTYHYNEIQLAVKLHTPRDGYQFRRRRITCAGR